MLLCLTIAIYKFEPVPEAGWQDSNAILKSLKEMFSQQVPGFQIVFREKMKNLVDAYKLLLMTRREVKELKGADYALLGSVSREWEISKVERIIKTKTGKGKEKLKEFKKKILKKGYRIIEIKEWEEVKETEKEKKKIWKWKIKYFKGYKIKEVVSWHVYWQLVNIRSLKIEKSGELNVPVSTYIEISPKKSFIPPPAAQKIPQLLQTAAQAVAKKLVETLLHSFSGYFGRTAFENGEPVVKARSKQRLIKEKVYIAKKIEGTNVFTVTGEGEIFWKANTPEGAVYQYVPRRGSFEKELYVFRKIKLKPQESLFALIVPSNLPSVRGKAVKILPPVKSEIFLSYGRVLPAARVSATFGPNFYIDPFQGMTNHIGFTLWLSPRFKSATSIARNYIVGELGAVINRWFLGGLFGMGISSIGLAGWGISRAVAPYFTFGFMLDIPSIIQYIRESSELTKSFYPEKGDPGKVLGFYIKGGVDLIVKITKWGCIKLSPQVVYIDAFYIDAGTSLESLSINLTCGVETW